MARKQTPLDLKGYYRTLKVARDSSTDEIRLGYAMAKQTAAGPHLARIQRAFEVLKDPEQRRRYDAEGLARFKPLKSPWTLVAAVVVLFAALLFLWVPDMKMRGKTFRPGQTLVEIASQREFGTILRAESAHGFPQGIVAPGYLVRLASSGEERWYPAVDLQASCEAR